MLIRTFVFPKSPKTNLNAANQKRPAKFSIIMSSTGELTRFKLTLAPIVIVGPAVFEEVVAVM